jgi:hypothetical protein
MKYEFLPNQDPELFSYISEEETRQENELSDCF